MAIKFLDNLNLVGNQLLNTKLQVLAGDPTGVAILGEGQIFFDSSAGVKAFKYYDGTDWIDPAAGSYTSWTLTSEDGTNRSIVNGSSVNISGGTGITTSTSNPTGNIFIAALNLDLATATTKGGIELFSDTDQSVAANTVSTTAGRTYGIQLNSSGQGVVNVPWTDSTTTVELNFDASDGSSSQVANNGTMTFAQGTGITTTGDDAGTLTITNSKPFDSLTLASTSGSNSTIGNSGTITIAAGIGITTTNNASGQITIAATGSGSMSDFILSGDSGTNQTISDGNTLNIAGGTNISTVVGTTDKVTVNLDDTITLAGDLTVSGGDITLGGTGRIQGIDTVTDGTDAVNKTYVDNAVVGNLIFQGGYNAATNTPDLDSSPSSSIKKGWAYVVTAAGSFFTETVEVGDFLFAQSDAPTALTDWVTVQNNVGLATASTVGIGNVNVNGAGNLDGLALDYSSGTATVGVDIANTPVASAALSEMAFLVYDGNTTATNLNLDISSLATYINANTAREFVGTSASGTTHTFTHNLGTRNVIVQLFDTSSFDTVYATVVRTSVNVVTVTTAATADITCLITQIG